MKHIILITGAGKGIGKAIALEFAKQATRNDRFEPILILASRTETDLQTVATACEKWHAQTEIIPVELADLKEVERLAGTVLERHGTIDCLVNNAGVGRFKPFGELTEEDFDYSVGTNMKGTFFLTQKLFPIMEANRKGHIFFITSIAAEKVFKTSSVYSMTKFAQKGLTEALRLYAKECNVRITNVMPGPVFTPMWGEVPEKMAVMMVQPEDIAVPVVGAYMLPGRTTIEELVIGPVVGDINE